MKINSKALTISTTVVIWLIVAMTIVGELSEPFKLSIAKIGGHHWAGKSLVASISFVVLYLLFIKAKESENVFKGTLWIVSSMVLGGLIIFSFFVQHFLGA